MKMFKKAETILNIMLIKQIRNCLFTVLMRYNFCSNHKVKIIFKKTLFYVGGNRILLKLTQIPNGPAPREFNQY